MTMLLLTLIAIVGVAWLTLRLRSALHHWRRQARFARARALEVAAEGVLNRKGYTVAGRHVRRRVWLEVDGRREEFVVEADYLVHDLRDALHVAEVKTGACAPSATYTPTRRQLLEYDLAFAEAQGLLLVNMERETVQEVRFPTPGEIRGSL